MFDQLKKRDGRIESFDSSKTTKAIEKAGVATSEFEHREALGWYITPFQG